MHGVVQLVRPSGVAQVDEQRDIEAQRLGDLVLVGIAPTTVVTVSPLVWIRSCAWTSHPALDGATLPSERFRVRVTESAFGPRFL